MTGLISVRRPWPSPRTFEDERVVDVIAVIFLRTVFIGHGRGTVGHLRGHAFIRYSLIAAFIATFAYLVPSIAEAEQAIAGIDWSEPVVFVLSLVLAYATIRVRDETVRSKLAIGVVAGFAVVGATMLASSIEGLVLLALAIVVSYLEWPADAPAARTS